MPRPSPAERLRGDHLLRWALRAYPRPDREGYGDELLEAARELAAEESTVRRETLGLLHGGTQARFARVRAGLGAVDLRRGLELAAGPLIAFVLMVWTLAGAARIAGVTNEWNVSGPSIGSVVLLSALAILLIAAARRQRGAATAASSLLALQVVLSAIWQSARGGIVSAAPVLHLHVGPWWFGPSLVWSFVPFVLLLVPACWCLTPAAAKVRGIPRPWREHALARGLALLAPTAVLAAIVLVVPGFLFQDGGVETTELPGLLMLMIVVSTVWLATTRVRGRDDLSVAAAIIGIGAVPSVAYGLARFIVRPFAPAVHNHDLLVGVALTTAVVLMLGATLFFVALLAQIGLRELEQRRPALAVGHALPEDPAHAS